MLSAVIKRNLSTLNALRMSSLRMPIFGHNKDFDSSMKGCWNHLVIKCYDQVKSYSHRKKVFFLNKVTFLRIIIRSFAYYRYLIIWHTFDKSSVPSGLANQLARYNYTNGQTRWLKDFLVTTNREITRFVLRLSHARKSPKTFMAILPMYTFRIFKDASSILLRCG